MPERLSLVGQGTSAALATERRWVRELAAQTDALKAHAGLQAFLRFLSCSWSYSAFNRCLLACQRPGLEYVNSKKRWLALGRPVKPGAEELVVLARTQRRRFVLVPVYDVRDTEGPPFRQPRWALEGGSRLLPAIRGAAERLKIQVEEVKSLPGATGCALPGRRVLLRAGLPGAEAATTLIHEYAHVLLHVEAEVEVPRRIAEAEAEAVAYVVARSLRLKTKAPEYLAFFRVDSEVLRRSLRRISGTAKVIRQAVEACRKPKERT